MGSCTVLLCPVAASSIYELSVSSQSTQVLSISEKPRVDAQRVAAQAQIIHLCEISLAITEVTLYVVRQQGQLFKMTNYYKPDTSYWGYGGDYGGLQILTTFDKSAYSLR